MSGETLPARERLCNTPTADILYRGGNGRPCCADIRFGHSHGRQEIPDRPCETSLKAELRLVPSTVYEVRMVNLRHLRDGLPGDERGKQRGMAEKLGMSESQLSQLIGKSPSKPIGDRLARKIEKKLGLPAGFLDSFNSDISRDAAEVARSYQRLSPAQQRAIRDVIGSYKAK